MGGWVYRNIEDQRTTNHLEFLHLEYLLLEMKLAYILLEAVILALSELIGINCVDLDFIHF